MVLISEDSSTEGEIDVEIEEVLFDHTYILSSLKAKELIGISKDKIINNRSVYINNFLFLKNIKNLLNKY